MAQPGSTLGSASQHFGKTEETINRALMIAQSAASPVRVGAPAQVEPIDETAAHSILQCFLSLKGRDLPAP